MENKMGLSWAKLSPGRAFMRIYAIEFLGLEYYLANPCKQTTFTYKFIFVSTA